MNYKETKSFVSSSHASFGRRMAEIALGFLGAALIAYSVAFLGSWILMIAFPGIGGFWADMSGLKKFAFFAVPPYVLYCIGISRLHKKHKDLAIGACLFVVFDFLEGLSHIVFGSI